MTHTTDAAPAGAALSVHPDDPDIRILRRVTALKDFPLAPPTDGPLRFVTVVDTETTGTDPIQDEIIDIAVVTLEVDAAGEIVGILSSGQALRDPRMPIPPYITKLTGITDADVRGRVIDLDRLENRLSKADVLVAHNASFDIAFIENLMPGIAGAAWACSANDFDWLEAGLDGRKLGHLLMQIGRFNDAHRAMADVVSLIHLLAPAPAWRHRDRRPARQRGEADGSLRGDCCGFRPAKHIEKPRLPLEPAPEGLVVRDRRGRVRGRGTLVPPARRTARTGAADDADHLAPASPLSLRAARRNAPPPSRMNGVSSPDWGKCSDGES